MTTALPIFDPANYPSFVELRGTHTTIERTKVGSVMIDEGREEVSGYIARFTQYDRCLVDGETKVMEKHVAYAVDVPGFYEEDGCSLRQAERWVAKELEAIRMANT